VFFIRTVIFVSLALGIGACGPREEKVATPPPAAAPAPPPAPGTVQALRLTPESATLAVAFRSSGEMLDEWLELAKRLYPRPEELQALVDEGLRIGSEELKAPRAGSFSELLRAQGIDPVGPAALFVDTSPMTEAYRAASGRLGGGANAEGVRPWRPLSEPEPTPRRIDIEASPVLAAAFRYVDAALAERAAKDFVARGAQADPERVDSSNEVTIHVLSVGKLGYVLRDGWLILGNSEAFVQKVAQRIERPAAVRYGSADVPARPTDQAVALVRADVLAQLARDVLPLVALARPRLAPWIELQYPLLERGANAYSSDPAVVTLERDGDKIELLSRLDYSRHPNLGKVFGAPAPLGLASLSPEATVGMLSFRITDETKNTLESAWFAGLKERRIRDSQVQMSLGVMRLLLSLTRNNVAIAVTGVKDGWPLGVVVIEVESPESTKAWLATMGMSLEPSEVYQGTELMQVPLPLPVEVHYGFSGNRLILTDDLAALRSALDLAQSGAVSPFFTALDPPFDPSRPRYNGLVLTDRFFGEVLRPLVVGSRQEGDLVAATVAQAAANVRQVRASRSVENGWREGRVTLYLRPEAGGGTENNSE
jgi:hypothetical protein